MIQPGIDRTRRRVASLLSLLAVPALPACMAPRPLAVGASDAPEPWDRASLAYQGAPSHAQALAIWRTPEAINAWIGARFEYDHARALALSESQRARHPPLPIHSPSDFFLAPRGVCVDLARFGVESLQRVAPGLKPRYLMIEFDPATLQGQVLRRHWVASFERDRQVWVFADSKRPGHMAGPYASLADFIADYARYRGRPIVAHQSRGSYQRRLRQPAGQTRRADVVSPGGEAAVGRRD
jgi:hypothetical protein